MVKYILSYHELKADVPQEVRPPHPWATVVEMSTLPEADKGGRVALLWTVPEEQWVKGARQ